MALTNPISCNFKTDRLVVQLLGNDVDLNLMANQTIDILSPEVTKSLPPGWQDITNQNKAFDWLNDRINESVCLLVRLKSEQNLIGFIFLYADDKSEPPLDIRFGYLIGKTYWGKGFGTEVLKGFVEWSKKSGVVNRIEGGVEKVNKGSITVLERVGFSRMNGSHADNYFYEKQIF